MKAICPKNRKHKRFITVAHIMQEWVVDEHGEFIRITKGGECLEVTHKPTMGNIWTCATCGTEAETEFEED